MIILLKIATLLFAASICQADKKFEIVFSINNAQSMKKHQPLVETLVEVYSSVYQLEFDVRYGLVTFNDQYKGKKGFQNYCARVEQPLSPNIVNMLNKLLDIKFDRYKDINPQDFFGGLVKAISKDMTQSGEEDTLGENQRIVFAFVDALHLYKEHKQHRRDQVDNNGDLNYECHKEYYFSEEQIKDIMNKNPVQVIIINFGGDIIKESYQRMINRLGLANNFSVHNWHDLFDISITINRFLQPNNYSTILLTQLESMNFHKLNKTIQQISWYEDVDHEIPQVAFQSLLSKSCQELVGYEPRENTIELQDYTSEDLLDPLTTSDFESKYSKRIQEALYHYIVDKVKICLNQPQVNINSPSVKKLLASVELIKRNLEGDNVLFTKKDIRSLVNAKSFSVKTTDNLMVFAVEYSSDFPFYYSPERKRVSQYVSASNPDTPFTDEDIRSFVQIAQNDESQSQNDESQFQNDESQFQNDESQFQNDESQSQNDESQSQNKESQFQNDESQFQNDESQFQNDESQYQDHQGQNYQELDQTQIQDADQNQHQIKYKEEASKSVVNQDPHNPEGIVDFSKENIENETEKDEATSSNIASGIDSEASKENFFKDEDDKPTQNKAVIGTAAAAGVLTSLAAGYTIMKKFFMKTPSTDPLTVEGFETIEADEEVNHDQVINIEDTNYV